MSTADHQTSCPHRATQSGGTRWAHAATNIGSGLGGLLSVCYLLALNWLFNYASISSVSSFSRQVFAFFFNAVFLSSVIHLLRAPRSKTLRIAGVGIYFSLLSLYIFVAAFHYLLYRQPLGLPAFYAVIDTDPHEAFEFWQTFVRADYFIASLILVLPFLKLAFRGGLLLRPTAPASLALMNAALLASLLSFVLFEKIRHPENNLPIVHGNPLLISAKFIRQAVIEKAKFSDAMKMLAQTNDYPASSVHVGPATHILVIGESTTSRHMSLYGYQRDTTPRLESLRSDLYVAADACSSRTQTIPSLNELLTFATREDSERLFTAPNLLQIMKKAGYTTYWISNQSSIGEFETWTKILARSAERQIFVNGQNFMEGASWDERVLAPLAEVLESGEEKKFIIVHLLGTHASYALRYPKIFEHFTSQEDIAMGVKTRWKREKSYQLFNQYDNAIRYTDFVVSEILSLARRDSHATVTFLSDHGELVGDEGDEFGHVAESPYRSAYEIPLFFWLSQNAKHALKDREETLKQNMLLPFQTDELKHTLLDLYQVQISLHQPLNSLFSSQMNVKPRRCDQLQTHRLHHRELVTRGLGQSKGDSLSRVQLKERKNSLIDRSETGSPAGFEGRN